MKSQEILAYPTLEPLPLLVIFHGLTPFSPARGAFCFDFLKYCGNNIERLCISVQFNSDICKSNVSSTSQQTARLYTEKSFTRSPFARTPVSLLFSNRFRGDKMNIWRLLRRVREVTLDGIECHSILKQETVLLTNRESRFFFFTFQLHYKFPLSLTKQM